MSGAELTCRHSNGVDQMQVKYILAGAILAMLVAPGTASQLAARSAVASPLLPTPAGVSTLGAFSDPNSSPQLTIQLPTRFQALDIGTSELQSFAG